MAAGKARETAVNLASPAPARAAEAALAPAAAPISYARAELIWQRLAEAPRLPLSEAELSLIWAGQRFPPEALATPAGQGVRVLHPGRRNRGPGPDFLDAELELAGERRRGDVELHLRASGFREHGHHLDPAYDGLALHVVFLADDEPETRLSSGGSAPVAAFAPWLERRSQNLRAWLEAPALWREPCRDAVPVLGDAAVDAALAAAGEQRLAGRRLALRAAVQELGEDEAAWRVLLDCLGSGGDRDGFRRLARAFPYRLARAVATGLPAAESAAALTAALLHAAGLAPPPGLPHDLPAPLRPPLGAAGRPANRPQRRLRGLALLLERAAAGLADYCREGVANAADAASLTAAWSVAAPEGGAALLGPQRARELLLNLVLPLASLDPRLADAAAALLASLPPSPPYGKTRFLEANLVRAGGRRRVRSALQQQGLLNLLQTWCSQGGCGRCPLSPPGSATSADARDGRTR